MPLIRRAAARLCATALLSSVISIAHAQATWPGLDPGEPLAVRQEMQFGTSVAALGNSVLVGAPGTDGHGAAYLFAKRASDGTWHLTQKLVAPDIAPGTFGSEVVLDGTMLISDLTREHVYYFTNEDGHKFRPKALLRGGASGFGAALALQGCTLLVTSTGSESLKQPGMVHVFDRCSTPDANWKYLRSFTVSGAKFEDRFGASIALDTEGNLLVGAPTSTFSAGAVYYFKNNHGNWVLKQRIAVTNPQPGDRTFGGAVALKSGRAVVGAPFARSSMDNGTSGVAYLLALQADGLWHLGTAFQPPEVSGWAEFGHQVYINPATNRVMISAPGAFSEAFQNGGNLYIYSLAGLPSAPPLRTLGGESTSLFGESFSVSGNLIAIGEPNYRTRIDSHDGAAVIAYDTGG